MRLTLLYCDTRGVERGTASDGLPDQDELAVEPVARLLREVGHEVHPFAATFETLEDLPGALRGCEAAVNLCDGSGVDGTVGPGAPALLQHLGLPFTGCSADPYLLSIDKAHVRRVLAAAGVKVPEGRVFASEGRMEAAAGLPLPAIVKPREGFGSLGIDHRSVIHDPALLAAAVRRARRAGDGDVLVERYLPGRELSVALIGPADAPLVLPAVEFRFGAAFAGRFPVRTLRSKHDPLSPEYRDVEIARAALPAGLAAEVEDTARAAWRALGGDGYGRVDLRLDEAGRPFVIDLNVNCSLEIGPRTIDCGTMVLAARLAGWDDARLLEAILSAGLERALRGALPVRAAMSGRWTAATGHSAHALRSIEAGEVLGDLADAEPAGWGARRPWRLGDEWLAPSPPLRWARAVTSARADAHFELRAGVPVLLASRAIERFEEIRVGGRASRRGTTVQVRDA